MGWETYDWSLPCSESKDEGGDGHDNSNNLVLISRARIIVLEAAHTQRVFDPVAPTVSYCGWFGVTVGRAVWDGVAVEVGTRIVPVVFNISMTAAGSIMIAVLYYSGTNKYNSRWIERMIERMKKQEEKNREEKEE